MAKKGNTKKALLMSALSLLLCVSMLVGTTFAWFTDTVTSGNNNIVAGNLDIELDYWDGDSWETVNGATDLFSDELWEPGHTQVVYLKMSNMGTLALKYQLGINVVSETGSVNVAGEPFALSQHIEFGVVENINGENGAYVNREAAVAAVNESKPLATGYSATGYMNADDAPLYMAVVVYMPESVGNEANYDRAYNAPEINLGINLVATQKMEEEDSFGEDYDKYASVTVEPGQSLMDAIKNVEDGGIVFLENGVHNLKSGPIVIENKTVTIIGLGEVTLNKNYGGTHIFTVKNGSDVTIKNVTMDGQGNTREGIYVRWNSKVTLEDVVIKNTGGSDIMIDEASDAAHGENTASYVWLLNSHIEDVAMCASPVTSVAATQDTFVYFNYDADSTVGAIDVQNINKKPENIIINGVKSTEVGKTMQLYVTNDAELAAALETIQTNNEYWNKQVIVYLAAGEYSADHVINQYPLWNGIVDRNTGNNYQGGVPAGAPNTVITFVGETAATYSLRGAQNVPAVTFTGNVTINGFADAQAGFTTAVARTTFENIAFANSTKINKDGNIAAVTMTAAAANVTFNGCVFQGADYVVVGGSGYKRVDAITFDGCTFDNVCVSGYVDSIITVKNSVVLRADDGFLNNQNNGDIVVENCTINAGRYFVRTNGSNIDITVSDSDITMYESEGTKHLVYFRGSNESARFTDCTITDGWTMEGVDTDSVLEIIDWYEDEAGAKLYKNVLSGEVVLDNVSKVTATEYAIPNDVTTLRSGLFTYNTAIKTVNVPASVTDFGGVVQENGKGASGSPFKNSAVETIVLAEGITELPASALEQAVNLKSITIPASVTTIGVEALAGTGITELTIPATVASIGYGAFRDNKNLTTVTIEGDVYVPSYAFRSCTNLETVYIKGFNVTFEKGMIFTCYDTGDGTGIKIYVPNAEIKNRLMAADSAASTYGGYEVICEQTAATDEKGEFLGYYTDEQGTAYTYEAAGLAAALEADKDVVLADNVTVQSADAGSNAYGATGINVLKGQSFDGNGNSFGVNKWGTWDSAISTTGGVIKNVTINNGMRGIFVNHNSTESSQVVLENVIIDGTVYTISCDQGTNQGLKATNCTFNGWTSYAATIGNVEFINCSFGEGQGYKFCRPYAPTAFVNCDFSEGYEIDARAAVTFENCTINGVALTVENLSTLVTGNVANANIK